MSAFLLRAEHFDADDLAEIVEAGTVFAAELADIAHHEIADPGWWECYYPAPDEVGRLRSALARMDDAIRASRAGLARVERRARMRAMNKARRAIEPDTSPGCGIESAPEDARCADDMEVIR